MNTYEELIDDGKNFWWELIKGCLFWTFVFIGLPIIVLLVSNYLKG